MLPRRHPTAAGRYFVGAAFILLATLAMPWLGLLRRLDWDERGLYLGSLLLTLIAAALLVLPHVVIADRSDTRSRLPGRSSIAAAMVGAAGCALIVVLIVVRALESEF